MPGLDWMHSNCHTQPNQQSLFQMFKNHSECRCVSVDKWQVTHAVLEMSMSTNAVSMIQQLCIVCLSLVWTHNMSRIYNAEWRTHPWCWSVIVPWLCYTGFFGRGVSIVSASVGCAACHDSCAPHFSPLLSLHSPPSPSRAASFATPTPVFTQNSITLVAIMIIHKYTVELIIHPHTHSLWWWLSMQKL